MNLENTLREASHKRPNSILFYLYELARNANLELENKLNGYLVLQARMKNDYK